MSRLFARGVYIVLALLVCPLLAWNLAVAATDRGFGWRGFLTTLLAVPVLGAVVVAAVLRRRRREATLGAVGAVLATLVLVIALVFVTLSLR